MRKRGVPKTHLTSRQQVARTNVDGIGIAMRSPLRAGSSQPTQWSVQEMPKRREKIEREPQEPMGIVISGGPHEEPTPRVSAYVYSIEDETSGEPIETRAA